MARRSLPGPPAAVAAVAFLTAVGRPAPPTAAALAWFPAVGATVGAAVGAVWWVAGRVWPPLVAAAVVVAADLAVTGMLHFDGLVDSADGLVPHMGAEHRLEVMAAPDVGAFGTAVGGAVLLLRWAALASLAPSVLLVAALWCAARTVMAVASLVVPYARPGGGLATAFLGGPGGSGAGVGRPRAAVLAVTGLAGAGTVAALWRPVAGPVAVGVGCLAAAGVVALARRRIGGFTGDVLGAAGVVAETAGLVVAAARW